MELNQYKENLKVIVFDLDGTLAESKSPITNEMSTVLCQLLDRYNVAVISGGSFFQFKKQILDVISNSSKDILKKLFLFPTNGSTCYEYKDGSWESLYEDKLTKEEKDTVLNAWETAIRKTQTILPDKLYGEIMEDRGTQITFSLSGQQAPNDVKSKVDPDQTKRKAIRLALEDLLPDFSISVAGMTSIDITRKGIDKKYALEKIISLLKVTKDEILFMGDKIEPEGNDYGAVVEGVRYINVENPQETLEIIKELIL